MLYNLAIRPKMLYILVTVVLYVRQLLYMTVAPATDVTDWDSINLPSQGQHTLTQESCSLSLQYAAHAGGKSSSTRRHCVRGYDTGSQRVNRL